MMMIRIILLVAQLITLFCIATAIAQMIDLEIGQRRILRRIRRMAKERREAAGYADFPFPFIFEDEETGDLSGREGLEYVGPYDMDVHLPDGTVERRTGRMFRVLSPPRRLAQRIARSVTGAVRDMVMMQKHVK